jgi:hypothetical protein
MAYECGADLSEVSLRTELFTASAGIARLTLAPSVHRVAARTCSTNAVVASSVNRVTAGSCYTKIL